MEKMYLRDIDDNKIEVDFIRFFHFRNTNYLIYTKNEIDEKGYIKLYPVKIMESLGEKIARSIKDEIEWNNMQSIVKTVIKEIKDEKIESFIDLDKNQIKNLKIVDSRFFKLDPKLAEILGSNMMIGIEKNKELDAIEDNVVVNENLNAPLENNINLVDNTTKNSTIDTVSINNDEIKEKELPQFVSDFEKINNENFSEDNVNNVNSIWQDTNDNIIKEDVEVKKQLSENSKDYKTMYENLLKEKDELSDILTNIVIELTNYKIKYGELKEE